MWDAVLAELLKLLLLEAPWRVSNTSYAHTLSLISEL
jgi:hypothetical protein